MALRAATSYDLTYSEASLKPGADITLTTPDAIMDNQDLVARRNRLLFCSTWRAVEITAGSYTDVQIFNAITSGDLQGFTATSTETAAYIYCYSDDGSTDFSVQISGGPSLAVTSSHTSKLWRELTTGSLTWNTDGTSTAVTVQAKRDAGSGSVWVAGVVAFRERP